MEFAEEDEGCEARSGENAGIATPLWKASGITLSAVMAMSAPAPYALRIAVA